MKAVAIFPQSKEVRIIDHPEPEITSPAHVKLKILEVGVCGTDKELCSFLYGNAQAHLGKIQLTIIGS